MGHPSPDGRIRREYGSVKAALKYCVEMRMNKGQAAEFLGIDRATLRERAARFSIEFPCGYATRDMTLTREINRERMAQGNKNGTRGGRRRWQK